VRPTESVTSALASLRLNSWDWLHKYWILFDVVWAAEAALIQLCVNSAKSSDSVGSYSQKDFQSDFDRLHIDRSDVLRPIFGPQHSIEDHWHAIAIASIGAVLLGSCPWDKCACGGNLNNQSDLDNYRYGKPNNLMIHFLERSLNSFEVVLRTRQEELLYCNGELGNISDQLNQYMNAWYLNASEIKERDSNSSKPRTNAYIVPCPNVHPIPEDMLESLIEQSSGKIGLKVCNF
jgi:hypothetical protein